MPEFLKTKRISAAIEETIEHAAERVIIVSPYLKLTPQFKDAIKIKAQDRSVHIDIIYGKSDLKPGEADWLNSQPRVNTYFRETLHAKCYLNESQAIVTSMNLYEFSEKNNDEFGILLSKDDEADCKAYKKLAKAVADLLNLADEVTISTTRGSKEKAAAKPEPTAKPAANGHKPTDAPATGYCIQNAKEMAINVHNPVCSGCLYMNNKFKRQVNGKHCHACGQEHKSSVEKPLCRDCFSKYRTTLFAPAAAGK